MKLQIAFYIIAGLWVVLAVRHKIKHRRANQNLAHNGTLTGHKADWGNRDCGCGTPRGKWKPLAMNRPDNTVLLHCPQCFNLWEESMSMYGNKWRLVDEIYAGANYDKFR